MKCRELFKELLSKDPMKKLQYMTFELPKLFQIILNFISVESTANILYMPQEVFPGVNTKTGPTK